MVRVKQAASKKPVSSKDLSSNLRTNPAIKTVRFIFPKTKKTVVTNNDGEIKEQMEMFGIPKRYFQSLCKELSFKYLQGCRWAKEAIEALQMAVEDWMVGFFEDVALCMRYANRETMMKRDMALICHLRKLDYEPVLGFRKDS